MQPVSANAAVPPAVQQDLPHTKETAASIVASALHKFYDLTGNPTIRQWLFTKVSPFATHLDLCGLAISDVLLKEISMHYTKLTCLFLAKNQVSAALLSLLPPNLTIVYDQRAGFPVFGTFGVHIRRILNGGYGKVMPEKEAWGYRFLELYHFLEELDALFLQAQLAKLTLVEPTRWTQPDPARCLSIIVSKLLRDQPVVEESRTREFLQAAKEYSLFSPKAGAFLEIFEDAVSPAPTRFYPKGTLEDGFQACFRAKKPAAVNSVAHVVVPEEINEEKKRAKPAQKQNHPAPLATQPHGLMQIANSSFAIPQKQAGKWLQKLLKKHPKETSIVLPQEIDIDGDVIQALQALPLLSNLSVRSKKVNDAAVEQICLLSNLAKLSVAHADLLTKKSFCCLSKNAKKLHCIELGFIKDYPLDWLRPILDEPRIIAITADGLPEKTKKAIIQYTKNFDIPQYVENIARGQSRPAIPLDFHKERLFFISPTTLDLRILPTQAAVSFLKQLSKELVSSPQATALRLPICNLDKGVIEVIEKSAIRELNLGRCLVRDMERLQKTPLTSVINAATHETPDLFWLPAVDHNRKLQIFNTYIIGSKTVEHVPFTKKELQILGGMKELRRLDLNACPEFDDVGAALLSGLTHLEQLSVSGPMTFRGIQALQPLQRLRSLSIQFCDRLKDQGLQTISSQFKELQELCMDGLCISDAGVDSLLALTKLKTLIFGDQPGVTQTGFEKLTKIQSLERLLLKGDHFEESLIMKFLEMPKLQHLTLYVKSRMVDSESVKKRAAELGKTLIVIVSKWVTPTIQSQDTAVSHAKEDKGL